MFRTIPGVDVVGRSDLTICGTWDLCGFQKLPFSVSAFKKKIKAPNVKGLIGECA